MHANTVEYKAENFDSVTWCDKIQEYTFYLKSARGSFESII